MACFGIYPLEAARRSRSVASQRLTGASSTEPEIAKSAVHQAQSFEIVLLTPFVTQMLALSKATPL
jgi:hypothetical protein